EKLKKMWPLGSVFINKIKVDKKENIGRYISKYLEKNIDDQDFLLKYMHKKRIFKSKNLKKPLEIRELNDKLKEFNNNEILYQKIFKGIRKTSEGYEEYNIR